MTRESPDDRKRRDELASDLRHIAEEIRPLTDSLDSLYLLLQHVWQNRDELCELLGNIPRHAAVENERETLPAETLFCTCCEATSGTSLAEALRPGWQCIIDDEGNERGNYAGMCPACSDDEKDDEEPSRELGGEHGAITENSPAQKRLF
jgi:hypothetical protein